MTEITVPAKVAKQILSVQQKANLLSVTTPDEAEVASTLLHDIKEATRVLTETKTDITRPAMESLAKVKALFAPREIALKDADKVVRAKLLAYQVEEQDRKDKATAKIAAKASKGSLRPETAIAKMAELETGKTSGVRVQTRRQLEITNESLIPHEFMVPNREAITKALFAGAVIPGCELKEVKILNVV
jgi:hypothetical protein